MHASTQTTWIVETFSNAGSARAVLEKRPSVHLQVPFVVGEDAGKHGVPGVVARHGNQRRSTRPDDVARCGHWRRVADDEDRIRKDRTVATPDWRLRTKPWLRIYAKSGDGERPCQTHNGRWDHRHLSIDSHALKSFEYVSKRHMQLHSSDSSVQSEYLWRSYLTNSAVTTARASYRNVLRVQLLPPQSTASQVHHLRHRTHGRLYIMDTWLSVRNFITRLLYKKTHTSKSHNVF